VGMASKSCVPSHEAECRYPTGLPILYRRNKRATGKRGYPMWIPRWWKSRRGNRTRDHQRSSNGPFPILKNLNTKAPPMVTGSIQRSEVLYQLNVSTVASKETPGALFDSIEGSAGRPGHNNPPQPKAPVSHRRKPAKGGARQKGMFEIPDRLCGTGGSPKISPHPAEKFSSQPIGAAQAQPYRARGVRIRTPRAKMNRISFPSCPPKKTKRS